MDRFGQKTRQLLELFQAPRVLITGLVIAVVSVSAWSILERDTTRSWISLEVHHAGPDDPEAVPGAKPRRRLSAKDRQTVAAALDTAGIREYRFENERLQVDAGQAALAIGVLRRLTTTGDRWTTDWEKQIGQLGPFPTLAQYEQAREIALRKEIRQLLLAVPEIAEVQVLLARSRAPRSFSSRQRRVTATIGIRPAAGVQLNDTQFETLRQVVAASVPDLAAEDVVIFNQSRLSDGGPVPVVRGQQPEPVVPTLASSEASEFSWGLPMAVTTVVIVLVLAGGLLSRWTRESQTEVALGIDWPIATSVELPAETVVPEMIDEATGSTSAAVDERRAIENLLGFLVDVDPRLLAGWLQDEHPQVSAIVLAELPEHFRTEILEHFAPELREDLESRLIDPGTLHADVLADLAETLKDRWRNARSKVTEETVSSGVGVASPTRGWSGSDVALLQAVEGLLSEFDDMGALDARVVRSVFEHLGPRPFRLALAGTALEVRGRILGALPQVAALELKRDIDRQGPVRLSDIERSQREILKQARRQLAANEARSPGKGA